ncbi:uncharacterized protein LOC117338130 [Pecten maximus]|uniref:uncharacterized protein LOC117338130 n=1 Tax=Pecten maximus TaxID=6579 RepID=UPI001458E1AB|nr:uncharacterized protein LOC117338130 [Pecten maximus]
MDYMVIWMWTSVFLGTVTCTLAVNRKYATYSDRIAAREKVVNVENAFLRFVLEKQILFCPSISTCTVKNSMSSVSSCCSPCSCDAASSPIEHCPDYTGKDNRFACLRPQYIYKQNKTKSSIESYFMINRCPASYEDPSIERLCMRGHSLDPYNITLVLPVTDITNEITYKNLFCAMCNSRLEGDLIAWSGNVNCSRQSTSEPKTVRDLLEIIASDDQCNILFEPPVNMSLTKCDTLGKISECNVTGHWSVFDDDLDRACTSYRSVYRTSYQNIHCYICNVIDEPYRSCDRRDTLTRSQLFPFPPIPTFSGAIDPSLISDLLFHRHDDQSTCPPGTRYDGIKNTCRKIFCSAPLDYRKDVCTSIYKSVSLRRYFVNLMISPHYNVSYKWLPDPWVAGQLAGYSKEYLTNILFPLQIEQCSFGVVNFAKMIKVDFNLFPRNNETRVIYVNVPTEFVVTGVYNDVTIMNRVIESEVESYNTTIRNGDIFFDISPLTYDKMATLTREPVFINGIELTDMTQLPSFRGQSSMGACGSRMPTYKLSRFTFCPKINITNDEYNTTTVNDSLCLPDLDLCFSPEEFEYSDVYISLCSEKFFERVDKLSLNNAKNSTTDDTVESRVGLALVSLSILCLGVTFLGVFIIYKPRTSMSYMLMVLVVCLILYNIVLLSVPFPYASSYSCRVTGASLQFTSTLSVALLQLCVLHVGFMMRANQHFQNPYILKIMYVSYPVIMASIVASVTYWYVASHPHDVTVPWIPWGLPCYSAVNSLSLYISCFPVLAMLALTFLVCLALAVYSYAISFEKDEVELVHVFGFYSKLSFLLLLVQSFWYLISFARWTGNIYLFLVMNLISSLYIMLCSLTDSKLKAVCTTTVENTETHDRKITSGCPCNPARRQPKDFQPISEAISENGESRRTSSHL